MLTADKVRSFTMEELSLPQHSITRDTATKLPHGHVRKRKDGKVSACGGELNCPFCAFERRLVDHGMIPAETSL